MAEKVNKKNSKNIAICICVTIIVIITIVIVIILANIKPKLNDTYFVSDNTKYVLTFDGDIDEDESSPIKTHTVYEYSGDKITSMTNYIEYKNADMANSALEAYQEINQEGYKNISTDGNYLVLEMDESRYENLTASEVKQQVEFFETLKEINLDSSSTDSEE